MNISKRVFSYENNLLFTNLLESIIPRPVDDCMNMTLNSYFLRVFDAYDAAYPIVSRPVKGSKDNSWITLPIKRCIRKKPNYIECIFEVLFLNMTIPIIRTC